MQDWLAQSVEAYPNRVALIYGDQVWTYAELNQRVAAMAAGLAAEGIALNDHVGVMLPNCAEYVMLIHALARLGAVLVPLNARLTLQETSEQLNISQAKVVIASTATRETAPFMEQWDGLRVEDIRTDIVPAEKWHSGVLELDRLQGIIFTSGTTGQSKGAMLTFNNHYWNATTSAARLGGALPEDRWLLCMPLYHVGGLAIVFRCCIYGTAVVLQSKFDAAAVSEAIDQQSVTQVSLVPTMLQRLLDYRGDKPFPPTLRHILLGGAPASDALIERCIAQSVPIALTYGLTEAASQVATMPPDEVKRKAGSVGKARMGTTIRILDSNRNSLPVGEIGEIGVSGPTVMRGYYHNDDATRAALCDGVLHTGDLGYLDQDGDLWVVNRRTDLIVSGGENVYPAEVEKVLLTHPGIAEACVIGLPDAEWGQRVAAMIVRRDESLSEEQVTEYLRERIAGFKLPRTIYFGDELPRTESGKVLRNQVAVLVEDHTFIGTTQVGMAHHGHGND